LYVCNEWAKFISLMSDVCIKVVRDLNEIELSLLG